MENLTPKKRILVVGRHPDIMVRVKQLLDSAGYDHLGALTDVEATQLMRSAKPDALLLGGGVEPSSRSELSTAFKMLRPRCPVVEHFGGAHGLLDHLRQAFAHDV